MTSDFQKLKLQIKEQNLKLETSVSSRINKGRRDFIIKSTIYKNESEISDIDKLDRKEFEKIVKNYKIKTMKIDEKDIIEDNDINKKSNLFSLDMIKKTFSGLEIALNTLNVITVNNTEQPIVRTSVELDADIITILKQDLKTKKNADLFLRIHGINVLLVNKFFKMYFFKITKEIKKFTKVGKIMSASLLSFIFPMAEGTLSFSESMFGVDFIGLLFTPILTVLGYKYGAKIARPIIRHFVRKSVF